MALSAEEQQELLDLTRSTNDEVGTLAIVIRDKNTGITTQVAKLRADLDAIKAKLGV